MVPQIVRSNQRETALVVNERNRLIFVNEERSQVRIVRHYGVGLSPIMRLDRHDLFPLSVILLFGIVIPLGFWLGFGTRQQISHDLYSAAKTFTVASLAFALLVGCLSMISR